MVNAEIQTHKGVKRSFSLDLKIKEGYNYGYSFKEIVVKNTTFAEHFHVPIAYLDMEMRTVNNIEKTFIKVLLSGANVPIEIEMRGNEPIPKDIEQFDKVEFSNLDITIKPKASGSGQYISTQLNVTGLADAVYKVNATQNTGTAKPEVKK